MHQTNNHIPPRLLVHRMALKNSPEVLWVQATGRDLLINIAARTQRYLNRNREWHA